jgi:hypothetical protein
VSKVALDKILGNYEVKSNHDYIDRFQNMYEKRYGEKENSDKEQKNEEKK